MENEIRNKMAINAQNNLMVVLTKAGVPVEEMEWDDEEVIRSIRGGSRVIRPKFTVGCIVVTTGTTWEIDQEDFKEEDSFFDIFDAVACALLLPKKWELEGLIEKLGIKRTVEAIG